ncbi:helix-turn-helix transcriptional regulator [[Eubacterium] cellulosolvens]
MNRRIILWILLILVLSINSSLTSVQAQQNYVPRELVLTVYADGVVMVEYYVGLDVKYPRIQVVLFGDIYEDLIIEDSNGIPLDYSLIENGVNVVSLGASSARITYFTSDITNKSARVWDLSLNSPINCSVVLPAAATIISLNQVPLTITVIDSKTLLIMPEGFLEISYLLGVAGTRENALFLITEAETKIQELKDQKIIATKAEDDLEEARNAFSIGQYADAELYAENAKQIASETETSAIQANNSIIECQNLIEIAKNEGRTEGLDHAETLIQQAKDQYTQGDYEKSLELSAKAKFEAENAATPSILTSNYLWLIIIIAIIVIAAILSRRFKKQKIPEPSEEKRIVNLKKIFDENPTLRYDDRKVLAFIAEKGGEALETDIREKFELPRTTAWRMAKRLQKEQIIDIQKIGEQNLLKIKEEFLQGTSKGD